MNDAPEEASRLVKRAEPGERPPKMILPGRRPDAAKPPGMPLLPETPAHSDSSNLLERIDTAKAVESPDPEKDRQISEAFQRSLKQSTSDTRKTKFKGSGKRAKFDIQLDRHEAKYIIPISMLSGIREFIKPFCEPDPYGVGSPPKYTITTLQLDAPNLALHYARYHESLNRFKLRVRTYGEPGSSPVFLEVKRKYGQTIAKSRCSIPFDAWSRDLLFNPRITLDFKSTKEEEGFLDFVRLTRQIGAEPMIWIQYVRESYFSRMDSYARISFDTRLRYQPAYDWDSWGRNSKWIILDSSLEQAQLMNFSGVILELKTLCDTPRWMIDLVMQFDLVRCGNCKYSNGIWAESIFRGTPDLPGYAIDLLKT